MSEYAKGPDFSRWNPGNDWDQLGPSGAIDFTWIKVSEALAVDPEFNSNWAGAAKYKERVLRGGYHFFRPRVDPLKQADFFWQHIQDDPGEMPPALDFETLDGLSEVDAAVLGLKWLQRIEELAQRVPVVYTNYWLARMAADYFKDYDLWLSWPVKDPQQIGWPYAPLGWAKKPLFWQHTYRYGGLPGVPDQTVDFNYFNGSRDGLIEWAGLKVEMPALTVDARLDRLEAAAREHGWRV